MTDQRVRIEVADTGYPVKVWIVDGDGREMKLDNVSAVHFTVDARAGHALGGRFGRVASLPRLTIEVQTNIDISCPATRTYIEGIQREVERLAEAGRLANDPA